MSEEELLLKIKSKVDGTGLTDAERQARMVAAATKSMTDEANRATAKYAALNKITFAEAEALRRAADEAKRSEAAHQKLAAQLSDVRDRASSFGAALAKAAAVGIAAFTVAAGGAVVVASSLINSAEALGDAQARVGAVFGAEAAGVIEDNATIANSLGLTKTAYLENVGAMGQYATNLGLSRDKAADMAMGLTELAPKLAAYTGAEADAVNDAFQKALAGKTKGLADLGIAIGDIPKELEGAAKAEYIYGEILKQTGNAQAEWVNNQGDVANSMASLGASFEDVKATAGALIAEAVGPWLQTVAGYASDLSAAFDAGGLDAVAAKLDELTGLDVSGWLEEARDRWDELKVAAKDFYDNQLVPFGEFLTGTVGPAILSLGKFMIDHKGIIIAVAVAYGALKTAMAINKAVETAAASIKAAQAAWTAYRAGTQGATLATTSFGTALKLALGPIGWIVVAVGALYVAWKTNFGGIQEKTAAVVDWLKGVPATLAAGWNVIKGNLAQFGADFKAAFVTVGEYAKTAVKVLLAIFFPLPLLFTKSGRDMVMGLWNGLKAQWDAMVNWVKGAAKRVVDSVKGVLKIQSPSRVFYDIGRWIMEGWSLGLVAGGPWVVRSAHMVMNDVLAALRDADAKVIGAEVAAAAAKAAVDAALAADGVVQGRRESAADAWGRFYDEQMDLEDALHERKMANLEAEAEAARKAHEDARGAAIERIELQKRYIEGLLQQQRESEAKSGGGSGPGGPPALKNFDDEIERVEAKMMDFLAMLGFAGDEALTDFWRAFHDGGQTGIETAEELTDVLAALADEIGKKYDKLGEELETALNNAALSEENRHKEAVRLLNERKALIDALIAAQADADADLADLIAARDKLLQQAQEAIRAAQDAAEEAEDRIHAGVMKNIDARRKAEEGAHKVRMDQLEDERGRLEVAHRERMRQLQEQRDKITEGFEARERQIDRERTALEQLKLDLGVERAIEKLVMLQDKLAEIKAVIDSFEVAPRGRAAIEQRYKAMTERAKITTDAQRKALQDALASGTLNERDTRRVELLLAGRGTQRIEDLRRILGASADSLAQQASAQQQIVDFHANMIAIRERMIEMAETQLKIDQQNAADRLADIDKRIAAENDRHTREMAGIEAKIAAEQRYFDGMMDFLDQLKDAEDERHAQRMADIAAEYALELAKLGMTQAEIDAMVSRAQAEAERIAREVEEAWKKLQEEAEKAGALKPTDPKPQPGGPANGPSLEIKDVTVGEGTIDKVELGGITVKDTVVMVKLPSGRELAAEVIDTFIGDVALLDKFSARLNERAGANGQIRGGRP